MEYHIAFQLLAQMNVSWQQEFNTRKTEKHWNAIIVEASPIFHKLSNVSADNFYEFAVVFYNYVTRLAEGFDRLDVVFDCYFKNSLKAQARKGRGSSVTRVLQITDDVPFPRNFLTSFLCNTDNKPDLGLYLTFAVMLVIRTSCYVLLAYIVMELVSNNDSFNLYPKLVTPNPTWYNILSLIEHLTIDVCKALPYFYAFTGCDTVSSFNGKANCTFFDTWIQSKKKSDLTKTSIKLWNKPVSINSDDKNTLEFLVKTVYFGNVKYIENISLNEMRKHQFTQSTLNDLKKVAPSYDALICTR